jgi:hypothetical protein
MTMTEVMADDIDSVADAVERLDRATSWGSSPACPASLVPRRSPGMR